MFDSLIGFIREQFACQEDFIPLHVPTFIGNEKSYLLDCVDSTFVSSVGEYVSRFEKQVAEYTGARYAVAVVNGTAALHAALMGVGVGRDDEVITQSLSFVATCNAISYCGAHPVFVDVSRCTLGMCPEALSAWLSGNVEMTEKGAYNRKTKRRIKAIVPMHTFGHPCRMDEIVSVANQYQIAVVEDAAESLGSFYQGQHTGTFGKVGVLSFNGNKIMTTGGGGMILTNDEALAKSLKHLTTTAKTPHVYEFIHDQIGYNYRMPNLNAALGCAQLENLPTFLASKQALAKAYEDHFQQNNQMSFVVQSKGAVPNYWLNAVVCEDQQQRDALLAETNAHEVMTRPLWKPMHELPMFMQCQRDALTNTDYLYQRVVNLPSSVRRKHA